MTMLGDPVDIVLAKTDALAIADVLEKEARRGLDSEVTDTNTNARPGEPVKVSDAEYYLNLAKIIRVQVKGPEPAGRGNDTNGETGPGTIVPFHRK